MIDEFKGDYRFLSNFYDSAFTYKGIVFPTAEHAFQAVKSSDGVCTWVVEAKTPGEAKRRGREINLRPDWEQVKIAEMLAIICAKFNNPYLAQALKDTYPHELVEGNYWHDQFWGNCKCKQHVDIEGNNYLGRILRLVRDKKL